MQKETQRAGNLTHKDRLNLIYNAIIKIENFFNEAVWNPYAVSTEDTTENDIQSNIKLVRAMYKRLKKIAADITNNRLENSVMRIHFNKNMKKILTRKRPRTAKEIFDSIIKAQEKQKTKANSQLRRVGRKAAYIRIIKKLKQMAKLAKVSCGKNKKTVYDDEQQYRINDDIADEEENVIESIDVEEIEEVRPEIQNGPYDDNELRREDLDEDSSGEDLDEDSSGGNRVLNENDNPDPEKGVLLDEHEVSTLEDHLYEESNQGFRKLGNDFASIVTKTRTRKLKALQQQNGLNNGPAGSTGISEIENGQHQEVSYTEKLRTDIPLR
jgi:hypothetical protein